jgi:7-keto-8-aminopelargonate synthetase-like enzyme
MQVSIKERRDKQVTLPNGLQVVEFINCSYLGLDLHPLILEANKNIDKSWGVNFCCARSRFSIEPMRVLEEELSTLFGGRAITFPSVTTTHMSVLPLIASGILLDPVNPSKVRMVFDKFAHSSMQYLKPILATEAHIATIPHNDLNMLRDYLVKAEREKEKVVYVADSIYSMGGFCPLPELIQLSAEFDFFIYLDDAHGTSIFGENGEGFVSNQIGRLPDNLFVSFCLSKGFGCNGGGILVPTSSHEFLIRSFGQIYNFSAALDFSIVNACLAAVRLHRDGTVASLQKKLRQNVALYDKLMEIKSDFSPIRMIMIGEEQTALEIGKQILTKGFFVSVVFFPIVPRGKAQLRVCIAANHSTKQIEDLVSIVKEILSYYDLFS